MHEYSIDGGTTWQVSKDFNNLDEGSYSIMVRNNDESCVTSFATLSLNDPPSPEINFVYRQAPTDCMQDGIIIIQPVINSGVGSYEFSLDDGATWQTNNEFLSSEGGTFYPSIRNNDATKTCKVDAAPVSFATVPKPPVVDNVTTSNPTKCGVADGTITVTASSGTSPLVYSKDGGASYQNSNVFTGLAAATYTITVASTGQQCPIDYGAVTLDPPPMVTFTHSITQPVACVSDVGSISFSASGGSGSYSYSVDGGTRVTSTPNFGGLASDTYNLYVYDNTYECIATATAIINAVPDVPTLDANDNFANPPSDCNVNDGTISVGVVGDFSNLQFSIDDGVTWQLGTPRFLNLGPNTYKIKVANQDFSCPQTGETITFNPLPSPTITGVTVNQPTECTLEKGRLTLNASGGIAPLQYSIDGGTTWQNGNVFSNLEGGVYKPRVRNVDNTCLQSSTDETINAATPPIQYNGFYASPPLCLADGEIHVNATGGSGDLEYSIDGGITWQISNVFTSLAPSTYTIKVGDRSSICAADGASLTLSDACDCPNLSLNTTDLSSCTSEDASIQINASGGSNQFGIQYSLNGSDWGEQTLFTGLVPNLVYRPAIRYANGSCISQEIIVFRRPEVPTIQTPNFAHPTCEASDGQITINTTGGTGNLEYSINGGITFQSEATFAALAEGTYQLTARNIGDECIAAPVDLFLDMPSQPIITEVLVDIISDCNQTDGRIELVIANADRTLEYSYRSVSGIPQWEDSPIFDNLGSRTARVRVRNADGTCGIDEYANLIRIEAPEVPIVQRVFPFHVSDCEGNDGYIQVQAAGGSHDLQYRIAGGEWQDDPFIRNLSAGSYQVQVSNKANNTCVTDYEEETVLTQPIRPDLDFLRTYTQCGTALGTIEVRATGGTVEGDYQYTLDEAETWSADGFISAEAGTTHEVYIANGNRTCKTFVRTITVPDPRDVTFSLTDINIIEPTNCLSPTAMVEITGMGRSSRAHKVSTEYEFRIDEGTWQSAFDFLNLVPGDYTIEARTITGASCQSSALPFSISSPAVPALTTNNTDVSDCGLSDGILSLGVVGNPAVSYIINGTSEGSRAYFEDKPAGEYTVQYTISSTGCSGTEVITIGGPISPVYADKTINQPTDCSTLNNGQITVAAQAGSATLEYRLNQGNRQTSPTFNNLSNGNYTLQLRNQDATCLVNAETITINRANSTPSVSLTSPSPASCGLANGQINVSATGGNGAYEYNIGNGWQSSAIFSGLAGRTYTLRTRNSNESCEVSQSIMVQSNPAPPVEEVIKQDISCNATGRIEVGIINPSQYEFTINSGQNWRAGQAVFEDLAEGNYGVGVRNLDGTCAVELGDQAISTVAIPMLNARQDKPADVGQDNGQLEIQIDFGVAPYMVSWSKNGVMVGGTIRQVDGDFVVSGFAAGVYRIELVDGNGCVADAKQYPN